VGAEGMSAEHPSLPTGRLGSTRGNGHCRVLLKQRPGDQPRLRNKTWARVCGYSRGGQKTSAVNLGRCKKTREMPATVTNGQEQS